MRYTFPAAIAHGHELLDTQLFPFGHHHCPKHTPKSIIATCRVNRGSLTYIGTALEHTHTTGHAHRNNFPLWKDIIIHITDMSAFSFYYCQRGNRYETEQQ